MKRLVFGDSPGRSVPSARMMLTRGPVERLIRFPRSELAGADPVVRQRAIHETIAPYVEPLQ
jgi:hypothetical protein